MSNLLIYSAADDFCIWQRALPRSQPYHGSLGRKPIHAARASDRASLACRHDRHRRATDGTMAVGAARPAIRHREPARRVHHDRDRGGRACARGWLYAAHGRRAGRDQCNALRRQAQLQFPPRHRADRRHLSRAQRHGGASIGSRQDRSRVLSPMPRQTPARSTSSRDRRRDRKSLGWTWFIFSIAAAGPR